MTIARAAAALLLIGALTACNNNQNVDEPTIPSATVVEPFAGTLAPRGTATHRFAVPIAGEVAITLLRLGGQTGTITVNLAAGAFSEPNCTTATPIAVTAGAFPQLVGVAAPGAYCVAITDVGSLTEPVDYLIAVAHP